MSKVAPEIWKTKNSVKRQIGLTCMWKCSCYGSEMINDTSKSWWPYSYIQWSEKRFDRTPQIYLIHSEQNRNFRNLHRSSFLKWFSLIPSFLNRLFEWHLNLNNYFVHPQPRSYVSRQDSSHECEACKVQVLLFKYCCHLLEVWLIGCNNGLGITLKYTDKNSFIQTNIICIIVVHALFRTSTVKWFWLKTLFTFSKLWIGRYHMV